MLDVWYHVQAKYWSLPKTNRGKHKTQDCRLADQRQLMYHAYIMCKYLSIANRQSTMAVCPGTMIGLSDFGSPIRSELKCENAQRVKNVLTRLREPQKFKPHIIFWKPFSIIFQVQSQPWYQLLLVVLWAPKGDGRLVYMAILWY